MAVLARSLRLGDRSWIGVCALATALKLWLVSAQTLVAIGPGGMRDDRLYLLLAAFIGQGEWLGPFGELNLAKVPGYALWLVLNQMVGVRLLLSQAALYVLACVVLARAVRPALLGRGHRALVFLVVLFNPVTWADGPATRLTREGIYSSLTLLALSLAAGAALRLGSAPRRAVAWSAAAGLSVGLIALTREEALWLAPSLAIVAAAGLAAAWRDARRAWLVALSAAVVAYALPVAAVASINMRTYGVFELAELRAGYYRAAVGALTRVETERFDRFVPVPREARAAIAAVSPAFRDIERHLEAVAPAWTTHGCRALQVCDDVAGGWFNWALREAAVRAGKYRDAPTAKAWYEQLAREIDAACDGGRLRCRPRLASMIPVSRAEYLRPLAAALLRAVPFISTMEGIESRPSPAQANEDDLVRFEWLTHERVPRPRAHLMGRVESVGSGSAVVVDGYGTPAPSVILRASLPSEGGVASTRIAVETGCVADCYLVLALHDGSTVQVPISSETQVRGGEALSWTTEGFGITPGDAGPARGRELRLRVLETVTRAYGLATPALLAVAVAFLVLSLARVIRRRAPAELPLVSLALVVGVAVRLVILAILEVSAFPAMTVLYCAPAHGLLLAFIAVVLGSEVGARRARSGAASEAQPVAP